MEKNPTKLQVEILSASNVLSNYSNSNKMTSYLPGKNISPYNNQDISKITAFYGSPRSSMKNYEESYKNRGFSVETPSSLISSSKKEPENLYFLKSPLISSMDTQKNHSFNNIIGSLDAKKYELECKNMRNMKNENSTIPENVKLLRNSSMSKLAPSNYRKHTNETIEYQNLIKKNNQMPNKNNYEISNTIPKTFLANNQKDSNLMSPKHHTKIEQVYEKIKQAQSVRKKGNYNEIIQSSYASAEKPSYENSQLASKKESFIRVLNETSNIMLKASANKNDTNKIKILSPLSNNENMSSPVSNSNKTCTSFFKKENREKDEEFDKMYREYNKGSKANAMTNNFMLKENEKINENPQIQIKSNYYSKYTTSTNSNITTNENNNDEKTKNHEDQPKNKEDVSEYKRLQDKLNLLERKILSIKSNYDVTLKKNDKSSNENRKIPAKKNEFVSSSCNFNEEKDPISTDSQIPKTKKISAEITNPNQKIVNPKETKDSESLKKPKQKIQEEKLSLNSYVTQVKPHSIFPNNVYQDILPKALNINEISNNNGKNTPSNRKKTEGMGKASVLKLIYKSDVYYLGSVIKAFFTNYKNQDSDAWKEHFHQTMQAVLFTKFLQSPSEDILESKKLTLHKKECYRNKRTLIFDLDETLIHCNENSDMESDVVLPVRFPNGTMVHAGINLRPGIKESLNELSKFYEIIVFTASHSCYANVVLNYLDPNNEFIQHRLSRENCILTKEGLYIKDLRVLKNRDLTEMLIIDNAAYSFGFQLENGIPILPFYKDKNDQELRNLTNYLLILKDLKNIREINNEVFKMNKYCEFSEPSDLIKSLYVDCSRA